MGCRIPTLSHRMRLASCIFLEQLTGGLVRPSAPKDLPALGCSGEPVVGRVGNLVGFNLRSPLDHRRQDLRDFCVGSAVVSFRALLPVPQTDSERLLAVRGDERDLVLEPVLFSKQGNHILLQLSGELRNAIGLQMHTNFTREHNNLLTVMVPSDIQITTFGSPDIKLPSEIN